MFRKSGKDRWKDRISFFVFLFQNRHKADRFFLQEETITLIAASLIEQIENVTAVAVLNQNLILKTGQELKTDLNRFFSGQTDGIELRYTAELGNDTLTIVAKANVSGDKVFYEVGTPVSGNGSGNGSLPAAENTADSKKPVEKTKAEDFPYLSALRIAVEKGYGNVFLYDLINMLNEDEDMYRQIQVEFSARMRYHNQRHGGKKNDEKRNA